MNEPIQKTSAEVEIKPDEVLPEPFISALERKKYYILFLEGNKVHPFYCSGYQTGRIYKADDWKYTPPEENNLNEWSFTDVIMDTSKRDPHGNLTLVRMNYHPRISLVNVPFMVLPADAEKEPDHIPDVNPLGDEDHDEGAPY